MNENDNFESLRRLLALKRHETPPPGYFNSFSSQIVQRIKSGQTGGSTGASEELFAHAPWLMRLMRAFEVKPMLAGGFAGALCLLLVLGIFVADRSDPTAQPLLSDATATVATTASLASVSPASLPQTMGQTGIVSSTNPVLSLQAMSPLFAQQNPLAQPVSFSLPNN